MGLLQLTVKLVGGENAEKKLKKIASSAKNVGVSLAAIAATAAAAAASLDLVLSRARNVEVAQDSFRMLGLGVGDAESRMEGLLSQQELMQARNRSFQLGLNLTGDQFSNLAEKAAKAGLVMGQDVKQSINDVMIGLGRQSRLILDNLGVIVRVDKANKEYAAALGKTVDQLTEAQKKQAFMNAAMEGLDFAAEGAALKVNSAAGAWIQFRAGLSDSIDQMVIAISKTETLGSLVNWLKIRVTSFRDGLKEANEPARGPLEEAEHAITNINREMDEQLRLMSLHGEISKEQKREIKSAAAEFFTLAQAYELSGVNINELIKKDKELVQLGQIRDAGQIENASKRLNDLVGALQEALLFRQKLQAAGEENLRPRGAGSLLAQDQQKAIDLMKERFDAMNKAIKSQKELNRLRRIAALNARLEAEANLVGAKAEHVFVLRKTDSIELRKRLEIQKKKDLAVMRAEAEALKQLKQGADKEIVARLKRNKIMLAEEQRRKAETELIDEAVRKHAELNQLIEQQNLRTLTLRTTDESQRVLLAQLNEELRIETEFRQRVKDGFPVELANRLRRIELLNAEMDATNQLKEIREAAFQQNIRDLFTVGEAMASVTTTGIDAHTKMIDFRTAENKKHIRATVKDENRRAFLIAKAEHKRLVAHKKAEQVKAIIGAAIETARGIATLYTNPPESATHFAAAVQFGVAAAIAGATVPKFIAPPRRERANRGRTARDRRDGDENQIVNVFNIAPGGITTPEQSGVIFDRIISSSRGLNRGATANDLRVIG